MNRNNKSFYILYVQNSILSQNILLDISIGTIYTRNQSSFYLVYRVIQRIDFYWVIDVLYIRISGSYLRNKCDEFAYYNLYAL